MERLTRKLPGGYAMAEGYALDTLKGVRAAVNRLAAYEDTGLEPGEIERIKQDVEEGCLKSTARRYGIDVSRLRKLAQADREGRIEIIEPDVMECIKTIRKAQAMLRSE